MKERMREKNAIRIRLPERALEWLESQVAKYNSSMQAEVVRAIVDKAETDTAVKREAEKAA